MNLRNAVASVLVCGVFVGTSLAAPATTPYLPPAVERPGDMGREAYRDAPLVEAAGAENINPPANTPEAAVVKFLASRMRGDDEWRKAMVAEPSDRTKRQLEQWDAWTLERFQLRGRKKHGADAASIRVFFAISFDGRLEEGEDEFELVSEGDAWHVASPPA